MCLLYFGQKYSLPYVHVAKLMYNTRSNMWMFIWSLWLQTWLAEFMILDKKLRHIYYKAVCYLMIFRVASVFLLWDIEKCTKMVQESHKYLLCRITVPNCGYCYFILRPPSHHILQQISDVISFHLYVFQFLSLNGKDSLKYMYIFVIYM